MQNNSFKIILIQFIVGLAVSLAANAIITTLEEK